MVQELLESIPDHGFHQTFCRARNDNTPSVIIDEFENFESDRLLP